MKRFLSLVLALIMICSLSVTAFADSPNPDNQNSGGIPLSEEIIEQIAIEWAASTNPEVDIQVSDVIKLYG